MVTITKLDYTGREVLTYSGELEQQTGDELVVRCYWTSLQAVTVGSLTFTPGDTLLEYYYRHAWFNIFKLYTGNGRLKGWYCNLAEPVTMTDSLIRWRDLALDLVILPDGQQTVMDEDEFEAIEPSTELRRTASEAFATLRRWVTELHPPFTQDELTLPPVSSASL